jgi:hypothetical protein
MGKYICYDHTPKRYEGRPRSPAALRMTSTTSLGWLEANRTPRWQSPRQQFQPVPSDFHIRQPLVICAAQIRCWNVLGRCVLDRWLRRRYTVVLNCGFPLLSFFDWQISAKGCYRFNVIRRSLPDQSVCGCILSSRQRVGQT